MALGLKIKWIFLSLISVSAMAVEIKKVNFPDQVEVSGKKLTLNGTGVRVKEKFGMDFDVYVAGLYLTKKSNSAEDILKSTDPKYMRLVFLRNLDEDTLREGFQESLRRNCKSDCDAISAAKGKFLNAFGSVIVKGEMTIEISETAVLLNFLGRSTKIEDAKFARTLLACFIGEPPTPELKRGLLGI